MNILYFLHLIVFKLLAYWTMRSSWMQLMMRNSPFELVISKAGPLES